MCKIHITCSLNPVYYMNNLYNAQKVYNFRQQSFLSNYVSSAKPRPEEVNGT